MVDGARTVGGWKGWAWAMATMACGVVRGESIPVPNGSFEEPPVAFVGLDLGPWKRTEKPGWYDEGGGMYWNQLVGVFQNTAPGKPDHIGNLDGRQAAWLFALPGVGVWQEIGPEASASPVRYELGHAYQLVVDVLGNGGGMKEGVPLVLGFCHGNADGSRGWVATRTVVSSALLFPTRTHLTTFRVTTPVVLSGDAWAGKPVAIMAESAVGFEEQGGYWDLDHFRVNHVPSPELAIRLLGTGLRLAWRTESGWRYHAWRSSDLREWRPLGGVVEGDGAVAELPVEGDADGAWFYRLEVTAGE